MNHVLNCGYEIMRSYDPHSQGLKLTFLLRCQLVTNGKNLVANFACKESHNY